jgi:3-hydroxyisobutyrate dehydrogenase
MSATSIVAVLGAGALGAAMSARLGETGHEVRLWNRAAAKAQAAAADATGVRACDTIEDAVRGASVVLTVLRDGVAVADVIKNALPSLDTDAVWVQASTVGVRRAREFAGLAEAHGVAYLDAPVSGSTDPARRGKLVWLVSGAGEALARATGVLDDLGSSVLHLGNGTEGSAVKVAVNAWMTAATVAMSDVLGLCDSFGVDHGILVRALEAGPLAMPYAIQKAAAMDARAYAPGFAVQLALKDVELAAESRPLSALLDTVRERLEQAVVAGHGRDDLAAVDHQRVPPVST